MVWVRGTLLRIHENFTEPAFSRYCQINPREFSSYMVTRLTKLPFRYSATVSYTEGHIGHWSPASSFKWNSSADTTHAEKPFPKATSSNEMVACPSPHSEEDSCQNPAATRENPFMDGKGVQVCAAPKVWRKANKITRQATKAEGKEKLANWR